MILIVAESDTLGVVTEVAFTVAVLVPVATDGIVVFTQTSTDWPAVSVGVVGCGIVQDASRNVTGKEPPELDRAKLSLA